MRTFLNDLARFCALFVYALVVGAVWSLRQLVQLIRERRIAQPAAAPAGDGVIRAWWRRITTDQVSANATALWLLVAFLSFVFVFKDKARVWEHILADPWERGLAAVLIAGIAIMVISAVRNALVGGISYPPAWRRRILWGVPVVIAVTIFALLSANEKELREAPATPTAQLTYAASLGDARTSPQTRSNSGENYTEPTPISARQELSSVSFITPAGNETFIQTYTYTISWRSENLPEDERLTLQLINQTNGERMQIGTGYNTGKSELYISSDTRPGMYRLLILRGNTLLAESQKFEILR